MKLISQITALFILLFSSALAMADASFLAPYENLPLPAVNPPNAIVKVLPNGMRCYILEDHTIPVVNVEVITKTGSIYEPADKTGLAALTGMLMRMGGAGDLSPSEFDSALDKLGAVLSSGIGREIGAAGLTSLSGDIDKATNLLFDMILKPKMDESRLSIAKDKMLEELRRADDDPDELASYKYVQLVYGKDSPWARRPDKSSLANISPNDVREFYKKYFKAGNMILAAAGDFDSKKFLELVQKITADAPTGEVAFPDVAEVKLDFSAAQEDIARPISQAFVKMGHLSIKRDNPDKFNLFVLNEILGGAAFKSRLMQDIRTKRGMAYHINSSISPGKDYGIFSVGLATKADQAEKAQTLVREHIARLAKPGDIEAYELAFAKKSLLSSLIFEFDRPLKVVDGRARFYFYGYPDNYWNIYYDRILATRLSDLTRVAGKYLHPDGLKTLIVGP